MPLQIRTSETHPLQIAAVQTPLGGAIGVTFCPGKCGRSLFGPAWSRDLEVDLDVISHWGASAVISLVDRDELKALNVPHLGEAIRRRGIAWLHLPIADVSTPTREFEAAWRQELPKLLDGLRGDRKILAHCKGGLGRAGLVAALLLIESGVPPPTAVQMIRAARPGAIETRAQENYLARYRRLSAT